MLQDQFNETTYGYDIILKPKQYAHVIALIKITVFQLIQVVPTLWAFKSPTVTLHMHERTFYPQSLQSKYCNFFTYITKSKQDRFKYKINKQPLLQK